MLKTMERSSLGLWGEEGDERRVEKKREGVRQGKRLSSEKVIEQKRPDRLAKETSTTEKRR
jgi:hypothetical protein